MAVRQTGSANSMLRLYNAPAWLDRVHLFNRDCALHNVNKQGATIGLQTVRLSDGGSGGAGVGNDALLQRVADDATGYGKTAGLLISGGGASAGGGGVVDTSLALDVMKSVLSTSSSDGSSSCVHSALSRSSVPKTFFQDRGEYGEDSFTATLAPKQPFVVAGDTMLTQDCDEYDADTNTGGCYVQVHRIYGSDSNQMTLVNTNNRLPAVPPPEVPAHMVDFTRRQQDRITIPYSLTTSPWTHNPAAATENAVFYAVNPYWQVFEAFVRWCNDPFELGMLQLQIRSSFAPITIWRVFPHVYCPPSNSAGCHDGLFSGVRLQESSTAPDPSMEYCTKEVGE